MSAGVLIVGSLIAIPVCSMWMRVATAKTDADMLRELRTAATATAVGVSGGWVFYIMAAAR